MRNTILVPALALAVGCAPTDYDAEAASCEDCVITDANQYAYDADLLAQEIELVPGQDVRLDWGGLTRDLQGHEVETEMLSEAILVAFRDLTPAQITEQLAADTLRQDSITAWLTAESTDGSCMLSDFGMMGNQLDVEQYVQPGVTWLLAVREPGSPAVASLVFLVATEDAAQAAPVLQPGMGVELQAGERPAIRLDDWSSNLDVEVDFSSLEALKVRASSAEIVLDWSAVSTDGLGNVLAFPTVTDLFVGRYTETRAELEGKVFDLTEIAEESWTMRLGGSTWANLESLAGDTEFKGVSGDDTWMVALLCDECMSPAPRLVTFLEAEPE